jgi:hypothetical protein
MWQPVKNTILENGCKARRLALFEVGFSRAAGINALGPTDRGRR